MKNQALMLIFLLLISCQKNQKPNQLEETTKEKIEENSYVNYRDLIQKSLNASIASEYFNLLDSVKQSRIVLIKNDSLKINKELELIKFNRLIPVLEEEEFKKDSLLTSIYFTRVEIFKDSAIVGFHYDYENYETESHFIKASDGFWKELYTVLHRY